jgi:hypothetical protein
VPRPSLELRLKPSAVEANRILGLEDAEDQSMELDEEVPVARQRRRDGNLGVALNSQPRGLSRGNMRRETSRSNPARIRSSRNTW